MTVQFSFMNKKMNNKTITTYFFRLLFIGLLLLCTLDSLSQAIYPVQATTQVISPYTPYVPRYYTGTQEKLRVTLTNMDMQEPTLDVYLRMKITSSSFSIITPPEVYTPTIKLQAGVPLQLSLNDLEPYFKKENMRISGGQSKFYQTMQLPDNFYRFQFDVYEVRTNRLLSNPRIGFSQMMIAAGEPPFLNLPRSGSRIKESNIPNILFTWTPRHMNSIASAYGTEYEFTLVEIFDKRTAPENAFQYSKVLYSDRTRATAFTYTAAHPMLIPGMRYAWRVRAIAKEGIEDTNIFKNEGYSQIYWFDYTVDCPVVNEFGAVLENMKANITWVSNKASDYTVEYRKKGSNKWYTGNIINDNLCTIHNLKYSETYEYRIGSRCLNNDDYQYSDVKAFTLPSRQEKSPNCGLMPNVNLTDRTPIRELITGIPIFAGDFPVTIMKVTNSNGRFTGEGYVGIPYMKLPRVAVTFKNIQVNSQYQLIDGYFETKFDLEKNMIWNIDKTLNGGKNVGDIRSGEEFADFKVDYTINADIKVKPLSDDRTEDEIKEGKEYTIQKNENGKYQFIITDSKGKEHKIESDKMPVTIQDKAGNTYEINEKGEVTTISQSSDIYLDDETKDNIRTDIAEISFENTENSKYALDIYRDVYKKVTDYYQTYKPSNRASAASAKFMVAGQSDEIFVKLIKANIKDFDLNKVHFITSKGKEYNKLYDKNKQGWTVTLLGSDVNDGQECYVVYDETANNTAVLARLNLYSYASTSINVKLIPVNGFNNNFTQASVEKELNAIYNKVGITCHVEMASSFEYEPLKNASFKVDGSGFFATQTNDMKLLNAAYLSENPDEKALCLFIIQNVDGSNNILGDMPRGKQFGYLFKGSTSHTIAHEIGHGLFHLDHPFARANGAKSFDTKALSDNLMEYQGGTHLAKLQWDMIYSPGLVIGIFEKDADGMIKTNSYFWTPSGHVIYLENPLSGTTDIDMPIPNGTLYGFTNGGIKYTARIENNLFYGYQSEKGEIFKDKTVEKLVESGSNITVVSRIYDGRCIVSEYSNLVPSTEAKSLSDYSKGVSIQKQNRYYLKKEGTPTLLQIENCTAELGDYGKSFYDLNLKMADTDETRAGLFEISKLADKLGKEYFEGILQGKKWDNNPKSSNNYFAYYWALLREKPEHFSVESLKQIKELFEKYIAAKDRFNAITLSDDCSKDEILSIINDYFVFGQDYKYLFDAPISNLNNTQRRNLLKCMLKGYVWGRSTVGGKWQEEDIILQIFRTSTDSDISTIIRNLDQSVLYDLFTKVDDNIYFIEGNFTELVIRISNAIMSQDKITQNSKKLADILFTKGDYLIFDNGYFGNKNTESFSDNTKEICLKVGKEIWKSLITSIYPPSEMVANSILKGKNNSNNCYHPLDYMVFIPVRDVDYGYIKLKKGEMTVVPAILGYRIFKSETISHTQTTAIIAINTALCVVGVGELTAAIQAGRTLAAIATATDITLGVGAGIVNTVPEIAQDHPTFTEYYNYATIVYAVSRLGYTGYNGLKAKWAKTGIQSTVKLSTEELIESITKSLSKKLPQSEIDDIVIKAMYADDILENNQMLIIIDDLVKNPKFKNPEDILDNLNTVINKSSGKAPKPQNVKNLYKEYEEGKYWMDRGADVYISKKWSKKTNEIDVLLPNEEIIIECKNISGLNSSSIKERLNDIIDKFKEESKLTTTMKNKYPNHYGKISFTEINNPYYNLNKSEFIKKMKNEIIDKIDGVKLLDLKNLVKELHIENSTGRFVIKNTDW